MSYKIEKVAVLGSGTMGAQIAAHLANAGVEVLLLDIAPEELTKEEQARGLTLESPQVRNRIANAGLESAKKIKPAAFFSPSVARLISTGNFDDDLEKVAGVDWIIEAMIENLEIKRDLYARVEKSPPHRNDRQLEHVGHSDLGDERRDVGRFQEPFSRHALFQPAEIPETA